MIDQTTHKWIEDWAEVPRGSLGEKFPGHTCGVAYAPHAGKMVILARSKPALHIFDMEGRLEHSWGNEELPDAHGLTVVEHDGSRSSTGLRSRFLQFAL